MLARGWLAYPVTPMHALLPPKSGCINVIPRFALSRRRATALFRNPVRKAQRSVPGFSSTPTSACRRYATSPPSAVAITHRIAYPHRPPSSSSDCANGAMRKTAEERFYMLARGWLAYPVTPTHHPSTAEERLYKRHPMVGLHSLVAERRHSSVTRYAKRSVACRDSPRHQPLRAGGTPLPHHRRLPSPIGLRIPIVRHHHHLIAPTARCEKPPKSGLIC